MRKLWSLICDCWDTCSNCGKSTVGTDEDGNKVCVACGAYNRH